MSSSSNIYRKQYFVLWIFYKAPLGAISTHSENPNSLWKCNLFQAMPRGRDLLKSHLVQQSPTSALCWFRPNQSQPQDTFNKKNICIIIAAPQLFWSVTTPCWPHHLTWVFRLEASQSLRASTICTAPPGSSNSWTWALKCKRDVCWGSWAWCHVFRNKVKAVNSVLNLDLGFRSKGLVWAPSLVKTDKKRWKDNCRNLKASAAFF